MADTDYYEVLGVDRQADDKALKSAYRKLAMQFHPDRNPGDKTAEAKFKEINEAYDVLKDPQKRAAYDRYGKAAFNGHGGGYGGGAHDFGGGSFADIFENIFDEFMGGGRRGQGRSSAVRGSDLRYNLEITLEDAYRGRTENITVPTTVTCEVCSGSGAEPGTEPEVCPTCQGMGKVRATQGFFMVERTCPTCRGTGRIIARPCRACSGLGRVEKEKSLQVKIPAGVDEGTRIRLAGEGEAGLRGGPPGDLYIFVSLKPHRIFERDGTTLFCDVPVSITTVALGGEIEVPTLDGSRAKVKIPAGTQTGKQFRLRGKGMPSLNGTGLGDLVLQVTVETPVNLTKRQRELLEEFCTIETGEQCPQSTGFFSRLKELWDDLTD
ncbi:molecular chaperone DnaJ [Pedomonas mirosovicensis]|uniref:molecular chaperone DnaJ n=1 Tax=Pedomonas mirosovicensis TaxID=2908641 RepID=UPI0021685F84|nr:molecular chaperone DnaJ [Pedomonas mirosovicensis]MCH8684558.1 molecular chaperone DnaJ [Pedomonas mirosovicensis]